MILSGFCGPGEGFGIIVGLREEAIDSGPGVRQRIGRHRASVAAWQFGEEALNGVEPRARGRREVEGEARVLTSIPKN